MKLCFKGTPQYIQGFSNIKHIKPRWVSTVAIPRRSFGLGRPAIGRLARSLGPHALGRHITAESRRGVASATKPGLLVSLAHDFVPERICLFCRGAMSVCLLLLGTCFGVFERETTSPCPGLLPFKPKPHQKGKWRHQHKPAINLIITKKTECPASSSLTRSSPDPLDCHRKFTQKTSQAALKHASNRSPVRQTGEKHIGGIGATRHCLFVVVAAEFNSSFFKPVYQVSLDEQ